jgi:endonuclease/exonuclease/phosphatase family metal-dependent hydrolase
MTDARTALRIATYNVHKCRGLDRRVEPARIASVLREVRADVIGLQEVLSLEGGCPEQDQARFLADALGLEMQFSAVRKHRGARYGNLVLSALPLGPGCSYDLSVDRREERGCLRADVGLGGGGWLHVFNVHLGTAHGERRQQAPRLVEAVLRESDRLTGPRVVLGDFNEWTVGLASRLLASHFRAVDLRRHLGRSRTYPGVLPFLHLDHIYYDEGLELKALALHRTRTALVASDHLPLVADFEVRPRARARAARPTDS